MGKYGMAVDCLRAAEIVTAAGDVVRASHEEHADLFWGIRGGGGNFGVATGSSTRCIPSGRSSPPGSSPIPSPSRATSSASIAT